MHLVLSNSVKLDNLSCIKILERNLLSKFTVFCVYDVMYCLLFCPIFHLKKWVFRSFNHSTINSNPILHAKFRCLALSRGFRWKMEKHHLHSSALLNAMKFPSLPLIGQLKTDMSELIVEATSQNYKQVVNWSL